MKLNLKKGVDDVVNKLHFLQESRKVYSRKEIDQCMLHKREAIQKELFGTRTRLQTNPKFNY